MSYNPYNIEGKRILITGASSGIGRATSIECSKLGATCVLVGRNEARLQETLSLLEGNGHITIAADLMKADDLQLIATNCDKLDGVVDPYYIKSSGLFKNRDGYSVLQVTLTYSFLPKCKTCNKDNDD